jgi:hypothetical protein
MGVGQEGEPYVHRNQVFYECKPDANKREHKIEDMLDIQADARMTFNELTEWYMEIEETRCKAEGYNFRRKQNCKVYARLS